MELFDFLVVIVVTLIVTYIAAYFLLYRTEDPKRRFFRPMLAGITAIFLTLMLTIVLIPIVEYQNCQPLSPTYQKSFSVSDEKASVDVTTTLLTCSGARWTIITTIVVSMVVVLIVLGLGLLIDLEA